MRAGYDKITAVQHLCNGDFFLRNLIEQVGPCTLEPARDEGEHTLFDRLASSILSQQLSVKAAATIAGRLRERASAESPSDSRLAATATDAPPSAAPFDPIRLAALTDEELRACGISRPKVAALRDLADAVRSGRLPTLEELEEYDDDEVITALTSIRGIGRWTAEMQLIFLLGRPDVFPVADVGIRRGFEKVMGLDVKATPAQMTEHAQIWAPYRSVASWYLWRAVDQTGLAVPPA